MFEKLRNKLSGDAQQSIGRIATAGDHSAREVSSEQSNAEKAQALKQEMHSTFATLPAHIQNPQGDYVWTGIPDHPSVLDLTCLNDEDFSNYAKFVELKEEYIAVSNGEPIGQNVPPQINS